jgi:hypothetical protein
MGSRDDSASTRGFFHVTFRLFAVVLGAVAIGASTAVAAPPPGKGKPATAGKPPTAGKPATTGALCRPKVTVVLEGMLTSSSVGSVGMDVEHGNRWGRAYTALGTATLAVDRSTKIRRNGEKLVGDLAVGDRVLVQARACKADLTKDGAPPALTAARVVAHPTKAHAKA